MRYIFGCCGALAAFAFVIGVAGSLCFSSHATTSDHVLMGLFVAALTFIAALFCTYSDYAIAKHEMREARQKLLCGPDMSDQDFLGHYPDIDAALLTQTRSAVAQFFDVPASKVPAGTELRTEFLSSDLAPGFQDFVLHHVFAARNVVPLPFRFSTADISTIGDFANKIQRLLDSFASVSPDSPPQWHPIESAPDCNQMEL